MEERITKLEARIDRLEKLMLYQADMIDISDDELEQICGEIATEHLGAFVFNEIKSICSDMGMGVELKEET